MNYNEYEEVINGEKTYKKTAKELNNDKCVLNMNYDITFCSHTECNNKKCRRNQNNYKMIDEYISIADFSDNCGYLEIMKHKEIKNRRKNQK